MHFGSSDRGAAIYRDIGERVMLARRRADLTQRQLGERLGISHVAVGQIERGETRPDLGKLAALADALGVPLGHLVVID